MSAAQGLLAAVQALNATARDRIVRVWLIACSDADAAEWRRLVDTEKKRRQRAAHAPASVPPELQETNGTDENVSRQDCGEPTGQEDAAQPSPSPALPPGPPNPPTPPPASPLTPQTAPPDSAPAVAGLGGGKSATVKNLTPTSAEALALHELFNRRPSTAWSPKEIKAFKLALPTAEDIALTAAYTRAERAKGDEGRHRRELLTLLNNWTGEVDRARLWRGAKRREAGGQWHTPGTTAATATPPDVDPVEADRIAKQIAASLGQYRKAA